MAKNKRKLLMDIMDDWSGHGENGMADQLNEKHTHKVPAIITKICAANGYPWMTGSQPWCAATVYACFIKAGIKNDLTNKLGDINYMKVSQYYKAAKSKGIWRKMDTIENAKPGDLILRSTTIPDKDITPGSYRGGDHIEFVYSSDSSGLITVGGNTGGTWGDAAHTILYGECKRHAKLTNPKSGWSGWIDMGLSGDAKGKRKQTSKESITWHATKAKVYGFAETSNEAKENALMMYFWLKDHGYTNAAIAAIIGNVQHEGCMNPYQWQNPSKHQFDMNYGYGLFQYSKAAKYIQGAQNMEKYAPFTSPDADCHPYDAECQLAFLEKSKQYDNTNKLRQQRFKTLFPKEDPNVWTFSYFKKSKSVEKATGAWLCLAEYPKDIDRAKLNTRLSSANYYYDLIKDANNYESDMTQEEKDNEENGTAKGVEDKNNYIDESVNSTARTVSFNEEPFKTLNNIAENGIFN